MPRHKIDPADLHCYSCTPKSAEATKRRSLCVGFQRHRPGGDIIPHDHVSAPMRLCRDCGTLVHNDAIEMAGV